MAAWQRSGRIEQHRERLVSRMQAKGISAEFAERVFEQIRGFGEYGFPESHAASFALIAYATAWLRTHYPVELLCALLNAQPMGFYSPATLVEDARRRGHEVRPVDVRHSAWACTLEPASAEYATQRVPLAVRMGLRTVKGLAQSDAQRLVDARPFEDLEALVQRAGLNEGALRALAEAGALRGFEAARRGADRNLGWYTHVTDDANFVRMRVAMDRLGYRPDARLVFLGGEEVLGSYQRRWQRGDSDEQRWFITQMAPIRSLCLAPVMLEMATVSQARGEAAQWFLSHPDFARSFLKEQAEGDGLPAGQARKLLGQIG